MLPGIVGLHSVTGASAESSSPGAGNDPYWSNVVLLMGMDGSNGSTSFPDESTHARGNAFAGGGSNLDTAVKKFGTASLNLDGAGDYAAWNDNNDFSFGSGDFTVELWFYHQDLANTDALITKWLLAGNQLEWAIFSAVSGEISFRYSVDGSTEVKIAASPGYSGSTWHHIAFSRVGNTGYLCFNGNVIATGSMSGVTIRNGTANVAIGASDNGTAAQIVGHIDEVRITKGVGRYSGSTYTVPTAAFPRS